MLTQSSCRQLVALILLFLILAPPVQAAKGGGFYKDGQKAEAAGDYDLAVALYDKALNSDRKNPLYITSIRRVRFVAAMKHLDMGHKLREQGKLEEAIAEFQKSLMFDPSTTVAEQEIARTQQTLKNLKPGAKAEEVLTPLQTRQKEFETKMSQAEGPAELMPTSRMPINLRATNDPKVIFETIGKLAGINVLTDPDYPSGKRIPVELVNVTLEQALDYVGLLSKTLWAPITSNTIIIYADSKRRDHEPWVLKTIYLSNTVQPTEITEITQVLRNVVDITKIMQVNTQNALIIRASPDQIALAEKIINDIDKAKAEVLVDVMVLLVSRDLSRQFGITPVSGTTNGIQIPISFNPGNVQTQPTTSPTGTTVTPTTGSSSGSITLKQALQAPLNQYSTVLPSVAINAVLSDAHTKILQNPQIRASDGQVAKLRVGERVPIATGTFSTGLGGAAGGLPAAQTSFQYTDVGVIMEITPRVNAGKEVSLKVVVEVSAVDSRVNIGGVDQPVIGQRRIEQDIRLKEGEVNVLGGIITDSETITHSGLPLLGSIPILGHLFSTDQKTVSSSEMLVVLTPHIIRSTDFSELNLRGIDSGTQAAVGLRYKQAPPTAEQIAAAQAAAASTAAAGAAAAGATPGAATPGSTVPGTPGSPGTPTGTLLRFSDAAIDVAVGKDFKVNLDIVNAQDVNSVPFQLRFDPKVLKLVSITAGDFLNKDGQSVSLAPTIDPVAGTALVAVTRPPAAPGVSGGGRLVTLNFQSLAPGAAKVEVVSGSARGPVREPRQLPATSTTVTVK